MNLINWSPFGELDNFFSRRNGFGNFLEAADREWRPAADISETDKEYLVKADLPSVKKDDINISLENGVLTLTGERKLEKVSDDEKVHRMESFHGQFSRSFALPDNVDEAHISAECKDGVLNIRIPKTKEQKKATHTIEIS